MIREGNRITLTKDDFTLEWFSGTGPGGQARNKNQNCCRIRHNETGMVETGQNHRDRPSNQKEAFRKLVSRLEPWIRKQHGLAKAEEAREVMERGGKSLRTYNFAENRFTSPGGYQTEAKDRIDDHIEKTLENTLVSS